MGGVEKLDVATSTYVQYAEGTKVICCFGVTFD